MHVQLEEQIGFIWHKCFDTTLTMLLKKKEQQCFLNRLPLLLMTFTFSLEILLQFFGEKRMEEISRPTYMQRARDDHRVLLLISGSLWSWFQETKCSNLLAERWTVCNALEKQRKWVFEQFTYIMCIYKCGTHPIYKRLKWTNIFLFCTLCYL